MSDAVAKAEEDVQAIRGVIAALSAAWQARRYDDLSDHFDDASVIVGPGFQGRVEERSACIESYREFMERVKLTHYEEAAPTVDIWGDTAVATYRWRMEWISGGTSNNEAGHDILVLRRHRSDSGAMWKVVWRTITSEPMHG